MVLICRAALTNAQAHQRPFGYQPEAVIHDNSTLPGQNTQQPTTRKTLLATAIASLALGAVPALAQDAVQSGNQQKPQTLQLAQTPINNETGRTDICHPRSGADVGPG